MPKSTIDELPGNWESIIDIGRRQWTCGYCGRDVAERNGFKTSVALGDPKCQLVLPCPQCNRPTAFLDGRQCPGARPGRDVLHLSSDVERCYNEARDCLAQDCMMGCALVCRTLLMYVAVEKAGAKEGANFTTCIDALKGLGFLPPGSEKWIEHIRGTGGRAAHRVDAIPRREVELVLSFVEALLRHVYELPEQMTKHLDDAQGKGSSAGAS